MRKDLWNLQFNVFKQKEELTSEEFEQVKIKKKRKFNITKSALLK